MVSKISKIFISSTIEDLKLERNWIKDVIIHSQNFPVMSENFIDLQNTPRDVIEKKVTECDAYIGIFHKRWGDIPKCDNPDSLSVTAIEFLIAKEQKKPRLILISNAKDKEPQLKSFVNKISDFENGQWRRRYDNVTELVRDVAIAIPDLVANALSKGGFPSHLKYAIITDTSDLLLEYHNESQKWNVLNGSESVELVSDEKYSNAIDKITELLAKGKKVILSGPHGIGKSILARHLMAIKLRSKIPVVVAEKLNLDNIREVLRIAEKEKLPVLYDPMSPEVYEDRNEIQGLEYQNLQKNIVGIVKEIIQSSVASLIVLPSDLSENIKTYISASEYVAFNLEDYIKEKTFLEGIIRAYSPHCNFPKDSLIVKEFVNKLESFNDGYTLIAAYIGRWLNRSNCTVSNVDDALNQAKGKPIRFLQNYVWMAIMKSDHRLAGDLSLPLIVRAVMGSVTDNLSKEIPPSVENMNFQKLSPDLSEWVSRQKEHLMDIAIKELIVTASHDDSSDSKYYPELRQVYSILKDVLDQIDKSEELQEYPHIDYKIIGYVQRWLAKKINLNSTEELNNLLDICSRNILISFSDVDESSNSVTKYLMKGKKLLNSSSVILKGSPEKINDILEPVNNQKVNFCNELSSCLEIIKSSGTLNEDDYIEILKLILGIGITEKFDKNCLINAIYGIIITSNTFSYLGLNVYWQTGKRLIEKAKQLIEDKEIAVVVSRYLKLLIESRIDENEVLKNIRLYAQTDNWIVQVIIASALTHYSIVTHNKSLFLEIAEKVKKYVIVRPSKGLILIAETAAKLFEACETFGEPEQLEYWYDQANNSIKELKKWGDANPDLTEFLDFYHHLGHYENSRWFDTMDFRILEMKGRLLLRENRLGKAEKNSTKILNLSIEKNLSNDVEIFWLQFKLFRIKFLRSNLENFEELNRIWEKALTIIRSLGRMAFLEILSMHIIFSDINEGKRTLSEFNSFLADSNSISLLTVGFFLVKNNQYISTFWDSFIRFLKLYAKERAVGITESIGKIASKEDLGQILIYSEIMQMEPSLLNNSSGIVGLILYGYLKRDEILVRQLLNYAIKKFGYIKIMKSNCEKLLETIGDFNSIEFRNSLLRLYFMRII